MNFMVILVVLAILSLAAILYPLRCSPKLILIISPLVMLVLCLGYSQWGAYNDWSNYSVAQKQQTVVKQLMQTPEGFDKIINKLKVELQLKPDSAKGWFLLGRLLANKESWLEAEAAFAKAYQLNPSDEAITVNYAHSLWQNNHQHFNQPILILFQQLLKNNPNQPDALAMLAMHAYENKNYQKAINYWQSLLQLAQPQSEEAIALTKAIMKANEQVSK